MALEGSEYEGAGRQYIKLCVCVCVEGVLATDAIYTLCQGRRLQSAVKTE